MPEQEKSFTQQTYEELESIMGHEATVKFAKRFGGYQLYIPKSLLEECNRQFAKRSTSKIEQQAE